MTRVHWSLHVRLEDRNDSSANALGYNGTDTKGGRGVPRNWVDGTVWKVLERIMDHRLETIVLHNSLHGGCLKHRGMGKTIVEAKLAQQLAHLEQAPFYGVFIDLRKAFDAMD